MRSLLPLTFLLLAACPTENEADEGPHCEGTPVEAALDEASPIGVVPADVLARVPAHEDAVLLYETDVTAALALDFTPAAVATFVDLEPVYPEGNTTDIGVICDDYVAIATDLSFVTDDGAFDEDLSGDIVATAESLGELYVQLDLAALGGTFDIGNFTDADYDEARAYVRVAFHDAAPTSGEVAGDVSGEDECTGDECSAWDMGVSVGTWGAASE